MLSLMLSVALGVTLALAFTPGTSHADRPGALSCLKSASVLLDPAGAAAIWGVMDDVAPEGQVPLVRVFTRIGYDCTNSAFDCKFYVEFEIHHLNSDLGVWEWAGGGGALKDPGCGRIGAITVEAPRASEKGGGMYGARVRIRRGAWDGPIIADDSATFGIPW
jgi:hypothetical protein